MTFAADLERFTLKVKGLTDEVIADTVKGIAYKLDERSPVGDGKYWKSPPPKGYVGGHFRANWQLGIDHLPTQEIAGVDPDGERTREQISASIPGDAAGKIYYLANNVPYALRIEDGWSHQAPQGLVGLTVTEFQSIVDQAVEDAKAGAR